MLELPIPSEFEQQHSAATLAHIQQHIIASGGAINFADYMQLALYAPTWGYYVNDKIKFGASGDFVTAPELSTAFSYCIAKQVQQILVTIEQPIIMEFGAGSGVMAAAILTYLQQQQCLPEEYWILEPSPSLQQLQQKTLQTKIPSLAPRVRWLTTLPTEAFSGVVLANEVLDAMPIHRFEYDGENFQELFVTEQLHYQPMAIANAALQTALAILPKENFNPGYRSEVNLWITPWVQSVAALLTQGLLLIVDYGYPRMEYYHPQRSDGTLLCYYRHRGHTDPFYYPGIQDITAHIDFTAVAEAADKAGFSVAGFCSQAAFLLSCDIEKIAVEFKEDIKPLLMPSAMGEVFKVMALTKNTDIELQGFKLIEQRSRL